MYLSFEGLGSERSEQRDWMEEIPRKSAHYCWRECDNVMGMILEAGFLLIAVFLFQSRGTTSQDLLQNFCSRKICVSPSRDVIVVVDYSMSVHLKVDLGKKVPTVSTADSSLSRKRRSSM